MDRQIDRYEQKDRYIDGQIYIYVPREMSMRKNRIDQSGEMGIRETASGQAINARPAPEKKEYNVFQKTGGDLKIWYFWFQ